MKSERFVSVFMMSFDVLRVLSAEPFDADSFVILLSPSMMCVLMWVATVLRMWVAEA